MHDKGLYCLAIVPARGGSKGLPRKNLAEVGGVSLVARAVRSAMESERCARVVCSTDDDAIAAEAIRAGGDVPFRRPAELAGDTAASLDVLVHAVHHVEGERGHHVDLVCLVEPTTPLRAAADVRAAVDLLVNADPSADSVVSLCEVSDAHPAWLRKIEGSYVRPYFAAIPEPRRRQDLASQPKPYRRNGAVYVMRRDLLMERRTLYGPRCLPYVMPAERSVNIDAPIDLLIARALWEFERHRMIP